METPAEEQKRVKWTLQELPIKQLKDHPKNPRLIGKDQFERLGNLIDKFGLIDKPAINQDMTIIGGHQRIRYLKKIKAKTVECWVADRQLSDEEIDELCIGLNLHQGSFDYDILADQWDIIQLFKYGFTEKQLLDSCEESEKLLEESKQEQKKKKSKMCPSCGHEF